MVFKKKEDGEEDEEEIEEEGASFNSGLKSIENVQLILIQISMNDVRDDLPELLKQKKKINLTKAFYRHSYPLSISELKKFREEILRLKLTSKAIVKSGTQMIKNIFDEDLDFKIDNYILDILEILQKKGYLMPSKRDDEGL